MAWWDRLARRGAAQQGGSGGLVHVDFARVAQDWQADARFFARALGVVRFAFGLEADLGARCPLIPETTQNGKDWSAAPEPVVQSVLDAYRSETETPADLVRRSCWLRRVTGEYVQAVYNSEEMPSGFAVTIRDPLNVQRKGREYMIRDTEQGRLTDGTARMVPAEQVRRIWEQDETWPGNATSPMLGIIADCKRYWALGRYVNRQANSRLASNGLLWTPSGMHKRLPEGEIGADRPGAPRSQLERDYVDVARASYDESGDDNAALAAPFLVNGSREDGPPIYVSLARPWDSQVFTARQEALEAIARGLPLPTTLIIEGPGAGGNHWGDWLADEHQARTILGLLAKVGEDVTASFLRPALRALVARGAWSGNPDAWRVGFDESPILVDPDLSTVVVQLWSMGLVSMEAVLRETGLDPTADVPGPDDLQRLRDVLTWQKAPPAFGPPPVDNSTTVQGPPPEPTAIAAALTMRPFPAESLSWTSS